jgi:cell filamentation protein
LPERLPDDDTKVSFTARSDFSRLGREQQATEAHMRPNRPSSHSGTEAPG